MKKRSLVGLVILLFIVSIIVYWVFALYIFSSIQKTHVEANIPNSIVFDSYLKRDLSAYFHEKLNKDITVEYELLRNKPTQSGAAYPKYYLWVKISDGTTLEEGAVRVVAIEQDKFDVTDYISVVDIKLDPDKLNSIFPVDVVKYITDNYLF